MLIGYDGILSSAVFEKDLPVACLFEGQKGIGKSLLCQELAYRFTRKSDVYELKDGSIDVVREFVSSLSYCSFSGKKAAIIDGDVLSSSSVQVLLKVVEEPPSWVRILIHTSKFLPLTIKSRCCVFSLPALSVSSVAAVLKSKSMSASAADDVAAMSGGSVSRAYQLIESGPKYERVKSFIKAVTLNQMNIVFKYLSDWDSECDVVLKEFAISLCTGFVSCTPFDGKGLESIIKKSGNYSVLLGLWQKPMKVSLRAVVFALKLRKLLL